MESSEDEFKTVHTNEFMSSYKPTIVTSFAIAGLELKDLKVPSHPKSSVFYVSIIIFGIFM